MKNTFAEICRERAENADPGTTWQWVFNRELPHNSVFIHHARKDIIELSRRLKLACEYLRELNEKGKAPDSYIVDELEAMPEEINGIS